jgi:hypothetical protein
VQDCVGVIRILAQSLDSLSGWLLAPALFIFYEYFGRGISTEEIVTLPTTILCLTPYAASSMIMSA